MFKDLKQILTVCCYNLLKHSWDFHDTKVNFQGVNKYWLGAKDNKIFVFAFDCYMLFFAVTTSHGFKYFVIMLKIVFLLHWNINYKTIYKKKL